MHQEKQEAKEREIEALVLCIDRDDDLGRKASVKGPVIGEEENFKAARALGVVDPEDSDVNAILAAIKAKRESEHLYNGVEVVTITGDKDVGIRSDQRISSQLDDILERYKPKGVIFVTDGAEDEQVLPLIQSRTKVLSIITVTIKQSKALEGAYFKIQEFLGRIGDNPRQARMVFGIPGLLIFLIVLLSYLGVPIIQVILAIIGFYLIIKGFGYEEQLFSALGEVKDSLTEGKIHKIFNAIAIGVFIFSIMAAFLQLQGNLEHILIKPSLDVNPKTIGEAMTTQPEVSLTLALLRKGLAEFNALDLMLIAASLAFTGLILHNFQFRNYLRIRRYLYGFMIVLLCNYISGSVYWSMISLKRDVVSILPPENFDPVQNLIVELVVSVIVIVIAHYLMKIVFFDYIAKKKQLEKSYLGKEVVTKKGGKVGSVSKVSMRGTELVGVIVKRKYYPMESLRIEGTTLVMVN